MKVKSFVTALLLVFTMFSCSKYDDSEIWDYVKGMNTRLTALEEKCKDMNTNITSLQTIVAAFENGDYITNVAPVMRNGVQIGYTISFLKSPAITIYNGADGKDGKDGNNGLDGSDGNDGYTPVIGVKKDADELYYWTIDGEWLLDEDGVKVRASGIDGKDGTNGTNGTNGTDGTNGENGITPLLKIENEYWYVSYDAGTSWQLLDKATGPKGDEGESLFSSIVVGDNVVIFVLVDGTTFTIPLYNSSTGDDQGGVDDEGHGWINLGLPSGTLWATCNVGTFDPNNSGFRFAWGETQQKEEYKWATYNYCNGNGSEPYFKMTKYCNKNDFGNNGFTDNLTELLPEDDAATVNWGTDWQTPSIEQMKELVNSEYTTTEWTSYTNSVKGYLITSKSNGNSIFLPTSNCRDGKGYGYVGGSSPSYYWSRSLDTNYPNSVHYLFFDPLGISFSSKDRFFGLSIRPVRKQ